MKKSLYTAYLAARNEMREAVVVKANIDHLLGHIRALRGEVIEISPNSPHHINPLEITEGYGIGENPVAMKSELMMSICEQQMGVGQLLIRKTICLRRSCAICKKALSIAAKKSVCFTGFTRYCIAFT